MNQSAFEPPSDDRRRSVGPLRLPSDEELTLPSGERPKIRLAQRPSLGETPADAPASDPVHGDQPAPPAAMPAPAERAEASESASPSAAEQSGSGDSGATGDAAEPAILADEPRTSNVVPLPPIDDDDQSFAEGAVDAADLNIDISLDEAVGELEGGLAALDAAEDTLDPAAVAAGLQTASNPRRQLEDWLATMVEHEASDLILRAGGRPSYRVNGRIEFLPGRVPEAGPMLEVLDGILGPDRMDAWREHGSVDVALHLDALGRFRLNAYRQMGDPALVLRRIVDDAPSLDSLNLPVGPLKKLIMRERGLVLVTGVAGSGKSTTMAAMIQHLNQQTERHVITLEDPVELIFREDRCVISQREVGTDCTSFQDGLRHALRQSPDLILIGEMRDGETVGAALDATETGHMVMSTLHTVNAPQTLDRILGFFPQEQHRQICARLAENLAAVLSMRLLPTARGDGMVPACELMSTTPHVRELLAEERTSEISRVIEQGVEPGQLSFNQSLRMLVEKRLIDLDVALSASDKPDELLMALRGISAGSRKSRHRASQDPRGDRPSAGGRRPVDAGSPGAPGEPSGTAGTGAPGAAGPLPGGNVSGGASGLPGLNLAGGSKTPSSPPLREPGREPRRETGPGRSGSDSDGPPGLRLSGE